MSKEKTAEELKDLAIELYYDKISQYINGNTKEYIIEDIKNDIFNFAHQHSINLLKKQAEYVEGKVKYIGYGGQGDYLISKSQVTQASNEFIESISTEKKTKHCSYAEEDCTSPNCNCINKSHKLI